MSGWGLRTKLGGAVHYDSMVTDLGRNIATIETGGVDGSWSNAELLTGSVDYQLLAVGNGAFQMPQVSVSGNTISWSYPGGTGVTPVARVNCYIRVWLV